MNDEYDDSEEEKKEAEEESKDNSTLGMQFASLKISSPNKISGVSADEEEKARFQLHV